MRKLSYCVILVIVASYSGALFSLASAKNVKVGLQIGHFSPQDWIVQKRFDDGDALSYGDIPYFRYSGFGSGFELGLRVRYDLGLWGLRLDLARKSMSDNAVVYDFFSSYNWAGEMIIYSVKSFLIHELYRENEKISSYLGIGTGANFADLKVTLSDRAFPDWPPTIYKGTSNPLLLSFVAGFDYSLAWNMTLNCEFEYEYAESDWRLESSVSVYESEIRNLNIGGTSIRLGIGYGFGR